MHLETREDGSTVLVLEDGTLYSGWVKTSEGYWYFGEDGIRTEGWLELEDGCYFLPEGVMATGHVRTADAGSGPQLYYFDENGRAAGEGWIREGEKSYYCSGKGLLMTGTVTLDHETYSFDELTGELLTDPELDPGETSAWEEPEVDFGTITAANVDEYARYILRRYGSTPREIYQYVYDNYTWRYTYAADELTMALRMFNAGTGGCWDYCAITCKLLRTAGYRCQFVKGYTPNNKVHEHDWVIVEIEPGVWRHMDPMRQGFYICLLTDKQLEAYNGLYNMYYDWDHSQYPAALGSGEVVIRPVEKSDKTKEMEATAETEPESSAPAETKAADPAETLPESSEETEEASSAASPETVSSETETLPAETEPAETLPAETEPVQTQQAETPPQTQSEAVPTPEKQEETAASPTPDNSAEQGSEP